MGYFDKIRAVLLEQRATSPKLAEAVADAEAKLADARAEVAGLQAERPALITADDETRRRHKGKLAAAEDRLADAILYVDGTRERLREVQARDKQERRRAAYDAAKAASDEAAKRLAREYPEIGRRFRALLRAVLEAEVAVEAANASLPDGSEPLASPEMMARATGSLPQQVVSERTVSLWCDEAYPTQPYALEMQDKIKVASDGRGTLARTAPGPGGTTAWIEGSRRFVKRSFRRREFLPGVLGRYPASLAGAVALPGVFEGDAPFWSPAESYLSKNSVLERLGELETRAPARQGGPGPRTPQVEFTFLSDAEGVAEVEAA